MKIYDSNTDNRLIGLINRSLAIIAKDCINQTAFISLGSYFTVT